LIFLAGATWGSVRLKTDFYTVENVHDFFDIVSSLATVIGLAFAAYSINSWRSQAKGEADHALAQRLSVSCVSYKESTKTAWDCAVYAICNRNYEPARHDGERQVRQISADGMADKLAKHQKIKEEFLTVLLEVKALWGEGESQKAHDLLEFSKNCVECARLFVFANGSNLENDVRVSLLDGVGGYENLLKMKGWTIEMFIDENKLNFLFLELERLILKKLL
jgi:hypothetical protein